MYKYNLSLSVDKEVINRHTIVIITICFDYITTNTFNYFSATVKISIKQQDIPTKGKEHDKIFNGIIALSS